MRVQATLLVATRAVGSAGSHAATGPVCQGMADRRMTTGGGQRRRWEPPAAVERRRRASGFSIAQETNAGAGWENKKAETR